MIKVVFYFIIIVQITNTIIIVILLIITILIGLTSNYLQNYCMKVTRKKKEINSTLVDQENNLLWLMVCDLN